VVARVALCATDDCFSCVVIRIGIIVRFVFELEAGEAAEALFGRRERGGGFFPFFGRGGFFFFLVICGRRQGCIPNIVHKFWCVFV